MLPPGSEVVLGRRTRVLARGTALLGGTPTRLVRLTPRNGTNPNYSPDGAQVVFQGVQGAHGACLPHSPGPKGGSFTCPPGTYRIGELDGSVFVVNADGTGLHRIATNMAGLHGPPSWSPDGRWILFSDLPARRRRTRPELSRRAFVKQVREKNCSGFL